MLCLGECFGNALNQSFVASRKAFLHKGGIPADEVDADGLRGFFQRFCI